MDRINKFKILLWAILGFASAVAVTRFIFGLGVTTNLTDNTPWGFWIGFDVMGGVALAGGGFVIAAIHYIFGFKVFHPIARAAILTAFLGYVAVAVGLLFDLGLPWNIWHMIIYWNPHSPLFEVGWCVMLYLTVLTLEFSPVVLEKYPDIRILSNIYHLLYKIRIPLVVMGIMLSTLHQSSLGSLFLAMPYRLHPLWYSPIIPIIFFVSAICLGLMMVMVESMTSSYLYKKEHESVILYKISRIAVYMLLFYLVFRFIDIFYRGAGHLLFVPEWGTILFWIEIILSVFIPLVIFSIPTLRKDINILYIGAFSGVTGVVFNRLNVGGLTHLNNLTGIGDFYFPSIYELMISAGVVSAAMLIFFYFIENYKVWEQQPEDSDVNPEVKPKFDSFNVYLGPNKVANRVKSSLVYVLSFALAFAIISENKVSGEGYSLTPVKSSRGGDTLIIDGNRDDYSVSFPHKNHQSLGVSCGYCHHLNKPDDKSTSCGECHYDMYLTGDAFRHDWHSSSTGANLDCYQCHSRKESKGRDFTKKPHKFNDICLKCHKDIIPSDSKLKSINGYTTLSYTDAMHELCINCHISKIEIDAVLRANKPNLDKCSNCHQSGTERYHEKRLFKKKEKNKWIVIPIVSGQ